MAKQQLVINRFEGGMNTDADPRDIGDNQFSFLEGFSVDSLGIIKNIGAAATHGTIDANPTDPLVFKPGYGLFSFSADYDDSGAAVPTDYLAASEGDYINIWDNSGDDWNGMNDDAVPAAGINMGGSSATETDNMPSFYAPNGALRMCDGEFSNTSNVPKILTYINAKTVGGPGTTTYPTTYAQKAIGGDWVAGDASIESGLTSANLKMINLGSKTKGGLEGNSLNDSSSDTVADFLVSCSGNEIVIDRRGLDHGTIKTSDDNWYHGMTCSLFGPDSAIYGVVYNYVYDTGTANQSKFDVWTGPNGDVTPAAAIAASSETDITEWSFQVGQSEGYLWSSEMNEVARNRNVISADYGVTLSFDEGNSGEGGWMPTASTRYKFYHSTIFDGKQESNPSAFTMYPTKQAAGETTHATVDEMWFRDGTSEIGTDNGIGTPSTMVPVSFGLFVRMIADNSPGSGNFTIGNASYSTGVQDTSITSGDYNFLGGNQRVTGGRVYYSSSEDGYSNLYLLIDYDLEKGARPIGSGSGAGVGGFAPWKAWVYPVASNPVVRPEWSDDQSTWYNPPILETYESINGYAHDSKLDAKWKTAVVANNRTYIGNVKRQQKSTFDGGGSWSGTQKNDPEFQDRIIKSPVGRYDTFPEENAIEALNSNDGDSIIKLETYADRLLVFKKNRLVILNIQKNAEVIEAEYMYYGLDGEHPGQACLTDMGVAWMNSQGVYFYDGSQVKSLTDNRIRNLWVGEDGYTGFWRNSFTDSTCDYNNDPTINHNDDDGKIAAGMLVIGDGIPGGATVSSVTSDTAFELSTSTTGGNVVNGTLRFEEPDDVPVIAYDPKSKKILCVKTVTDAGTDAENILFYSFKTNSWTYGENLLDNNVDKRFANFKGELIFDNDTQIKVWNDSPAIGTGSGGNILYTKDFDFGTPGVRKKIYKVYVTYQSGGSATEIQVKYGVDGATTLDKEFADGENFASNELAAATGWQVAELKPATSSEANNKYSFRLAFTCNDPVPAAFEINDITIVYRTKSIK